MSVVCKLENFLFFFHFFESEANKINFYHTFTKGGFSLTSRTLQRLIWISNKILILCGNFSHFSKIFLSFCVCLAINCQKVENLYLSVILFTSKTPLFLQHGSKKNPKLFKLKLFPLKLSSCWVTGLHEIFHTKIFFMYSSSSSTITFSFSLLSLTLYRMLLS